MMDATLFAKQVAFDRAFEKYGRRVDESLASDVGLARVLADARSLYPEAYCAYIENPQPNAVACTYDGHDLIALFSGMTYALCGFFYTMLSDPSTFENIGDPQKERIHDERVQVLRDSTSVIDLVSHCMIRPKCDVRFVIANSMIACAHAFVFYHEAAHLESGHLRLLQDYLASPVYEEFPIRPLSGDEKTIRRCLELDADMAAVLTSLRDWRADWSFESNPLRTDFDRDYVWATSIDSTFLFMEWIGARMGAAGSGTHPSSIQRLANARTTMDHAKQFGLEPLSEAASERKVISTVLLWIDRNLGESTKRALFENANGDAEGHELEALLQRLESFQERLDGYRDERRKRRSS